MTMTEQRALGDILVRHGVVTPEVLEPLYTQQREKGAQLTELLVQAKAASEADVARALAIECGLSFQERVDIEEVPTHTATRLPIGYAKNHKVLILGEYDDRVEIVCGDPLDTDALDDVRATFGKPVVARVAAPDTVVDAINRVIPNVRATSGPEFRSSSLAYYATSSGIVASFGLLVVFAIITGFSIVGLTMYSAVSDRIKDYGTLKAIGATNGKIRRLILFQSSMYAVSGFAIAYGLLVFFIRATQGSLQLELTAWLSYTLVGVTLMIALLGSLFGMRKITKLEPAAVFR